MAGGEVRRVARDAAVAGRRPDGRRGVCVLVALAGLAVSACGNDDPAPEVTVGEPPIPSTTVTLGPPDETGITPANGWPRACDLLTEDEVRAVLPQATDLSAESRDLPLVISPDGLGGVNARPTMTVPDATCAYSFALPGNPETAMGPANEIVLEVRTVGTPWVTLVNDTEDAVPGGEDAAGCAEVGGTVGFDCRKGGVDFALTGFVSPTASASPTIPRTSTRTTTKRSCARSPTW